MNSDSKTASTICTVQTLVPLSILAYVKETNLMTVYSTQCQSDQSMYEKSRGWFGQRYQLKHL